MNGPADNFVSACTSCHSTAQRDGASEDSGMVEPVNPKTGLPNPQQDATTMRW